MTIRLELRGVPSVSAELHRLNRDALREAMAALRLEAEEVSTDSAENYVPVRAGILRASRFVGPVEVKGKSLAVKIAFGGPAAPYAEAVHEHPSKHSPPSWKGKAIGELESRDGTPWSKDGRGPKYLERPVRKARRGLEKRVAAAVKKALR